MERRAPQRGRTVTRGLIAISMPILCGGRTQRTSRKDLALFRARRRAVPGVRHIDDADVGQVRRSARERGNRQVPHWVRCTRSSTSGGWPGARPSRADPARMNPPAPSSPRAGDGKDHPGRPSNLARVVLAAHLRPRDVARAFGPCSSRCGSRKIEAGTSRPGDRRRLRRQPASRSRPPCPSSS